MNKMNKILLDIENSLRRTTDQCERRQRKLKEQEKRMKEFRIATGLEKAEGEKDKESENVVQSSPSKK